MPTNAGSFSGVMGALSRMSDRERKLVGLTGIVAALMIFGGAFWWVDKTLDGKARRVKEMNETLQQVLALEGQYKEAEARERQNATRLRTNRVSLFSELQKAAGQLGLTLNDLNERQVPVKDSSITEVSVEVNLKQVSIDKLNLFLEKIEGKSSGGLVKILKLKVKTRHDDPELLDVNMTVATWKAS